VAGSSLIEANLHSVVVVAGMCISPSLLRPASIKRISVRIKIPVDEDYFAIGQRNLFCEKPLRHTTANHAIHVNGLSFAINNETGAPIQRLKAKTAVRRSCQ
jgi:hypothetical protein